MQIYIYSGTRSEPPQGFSDVEDVTKSAERRGNATAQTIQMIYKCAIIGPVIIIDSPSSRLRRKHEIIFILLLFWGCVMLPEKPKCSSLIGKKKQSKRQRLIAHLAAAGMETTHPFSGRTSPSSAAEPVGK